jgi:hypothetical protein
LSLVSVPEEAAFTEAEFLDEIQTKVLRVFLLAIHRHLYSKPCIDMPFSLNSRNLLQFLYGALLYTVKEKGGKPDRISHPLPYGLKSIQKPQVWELSRNCKFMN